MSRRSRDPGDPFELELERVFGWGELAFACALGLFALVASLAEVTRATWPALLWELATLLGAAMVFACWLEPSIRPRLLRFFWVWLAISLSVATTRLVG
ncbi:MAG: hypothetical protein ACE37K_17155 [Planctomycetota bacterium]